MSHKRVGKEADPAEAQRSSIWGSLASAAIFFGTMVAKKWLYPPPGMVENRPGSRPSDEELTRLRHLAEVAHVCYELSHVNEADVVQVPEDSAAADIAAIEAKESSAMREAVESVHAPVGGAEMLLPPIREALARAVHGSTDTDAVDATRFAARGRPHGTAHQGFCCYWWPTPTPSDPEAVSALVAILGTSYGSDWIQNMLDAQIGRRTEVRGTFCRRSPAPRPHAALCRPPVCLTIWSR